MRLLTAVVIESESDFSRHFNKKKKRDFYYLQLSGVDLNRFSTRDRKVSSLKCKDTDISWKPVSEFRILWLGLSLVFKPKFSDKRSILQGVTFS